MAHDVTIGLIGTGRIGQVHAMSIAGTPGAELTWVCDPFIEGAQKVSEQCGGKVELEELIQAMAGGSELETLTHEIEIIRK